MVRRKRATALCAALLAAAFLAAVPLAVTAEQTDRFAMQPWFNPAAEAFTNPAVLQDPSLFSPGALQTLWKAVHGQPIGPECPLLLCATHPLGLALIAGGLAKGTDARENMYLAEDLMRMGASVGNLYHKQLPPDKLEAVYGYVEGPCGLLNLRVSWSESQGSRRIVILCESIDPGIPLYSDVPGADSWIRRCLKQCPCASESLKGLNGDAGDEPPLLQPPQDQLPQLPPGQPPGQLPHGEPQEQPPQPNPPDVSAGVTPGPTEWAGQGPPPVYAGEPPTPPVQVVPGFVVTAAPVFQIIPGIVPVTPTPNIEPNW